MTQLYEANMALEVDRSDIGDDVFRTEEDISSAHRPAATDDTSGPVSMVGVFSASAEQQTTDSQFSEPSPLIVEPKIPSDRVGYEAKHEWLHVGAVLVLEDSLDYALTEFLPMESRNWFDWVKDSAEPELLGVQDLLGEEENPLESFFVERISQTPEVESLYKYEDGACTIFFTILSTMKYQQDVDTKVYEVEYMILQNFPDANVAFRCVPRLGMADEDFLPAGAVRIYSRGEKPQHG